MDQPGISPPMKDIFTCAFCKIVRGEDCKVREIARNSKVIAFFPTNPALLGHCMVIPRRHVESFSDLTDEEVKDVMLAAQSLSKGVQQAFEPDGLNIIQSNGEAASQSVPHVHVHVLPRWENDRVGEIWPPDYDYQESEKDQALAQLKSNIVLPKISVSSEDKRQHLAFAQDIISRMSQSSSNVKSWLLPVVTATYGYAFTQESIAVALLGMIVTLVFAFLDIGYLRTERMYRNLYERIAAEDTSIPPYSLNYKQTQETRKTILLEYFAIIRTWSIGPFYTFLILTGLAAMSMPVLSNSEFWSQVIEIIKIIQND